MPPAVFQSRLYTAIGRSIAPLQNRLFDRSFSMTIILLLLGVASFAALLAYIPLCDRL